MDRVRLVFLEGLKAALRGECLPVREDLTPEDWQRVMALAETHQVLPMILEAVHRQPSLQDAPFLAAVKQRSRYQVMIQTMKTSDFLALNRHLRAVGPRPLVVKGIICRNLYPKADQRQSCDEDLLIPPDQFPACRDAMAAFGMIPADPGANPATAYEIPFGKPGSALRVELHRHPFPPDSEAYGDLNRFFEGVFDRAVEETIQGEPVLTLSPTDHLFYLICHAFKHFLHSGFGIRQVCDIVMFADRYGAQIDWAQVLENCRQIRAEKFAAALFRIGENHLGFDPETARVCAQWLQMRVDEGPMLEDLLQSGIYGGAEMSRKHSSTITLTAVADQKQGRKASSGVLKSLFPPAKALENRYPYLKNHPCLLPAAWCQRFFRYGMETKNSRKNSAADAVKIGNQRVALMKQYDILD